MPTRVIKELEQKRSEWRKNQPFGFVAKPLSNEKGELNYLEWKCKIPGKKGTTHEGKVYILTMIFKDYPENPPQCIFNSPMHHQNVGPSGIVRMSLLDKNQDWRPNLSIRDVLLGIQNMLDEPIRQDQVAKEKYLTLIQKLKEKRCEWRQNPLFGFIAKPIEFPSFNYLKWLCFIPGKKETVWAGGLYKLYMHFNENYPTSPPKCKFDPPILHPNVAPSGDVRLSILIKEKDWRPDLSIKQILLSIQNMLDEPEELSIANTEAFIKFKYKNNEYNNLIKAQAKEAASKNLHGVVQAM